MGMWMNASGFKNIVSIVCFNSPKASGLHVLHLKHEKFLGSLDYDLESGALDVEGVGFQSFLFYHLYLLVVWLFI